MDRGAWQAVIYRVSELDKTEATQHTPTDKLFHRKLVSLMKPYNYKLILFCPVICQIDTTFLLYGHLAFKTLWQRTDYFLRQFFCNHALLGSTSLEWGNICLLFTFRKSLLKNGLQSTMSQEFCLKGSLSENWRKQKNTLILTVATTKMMATNNLMIPCD